ncbi:hypothetical protein Y032_0636g940 [Ancylostoma ceylanicum]|uniref:SCP domain-containing protein n=1 Tax=Ancylostoma ceylanicum TaxID=53326 RepID=A0A016WLN0_9BILA|nr:hypothetical protein Y032_0636g940 [Ancylostoma ceylanicum]
MYKSNTSINLQYKPRGDSQGNLRESPIKGNAERHKAPDNKHNVVRGCGPSCNTAGLTPEVRQQILDFHSEKGKSLSWDCDLEQKAYDSIKTNEVDTRSIGHPANEYAEMPGPDGTMEKNVKDALNYWWDQNRNHERDNMNNANEKVGCTYKVDPPLFHFICAYVSLLTGPYNRSAAEHYWSGPMRVLHLIYILTRNIAAFRRRCYGADRLCLPCDNEYISKSVYSAISKIYRDTQSSDTFYYIC